ncbi:MAG: competence/damage-inducible protein A, partial [Candidatus Omnitrophica bacterium]|nr:competence/damage-inducible protein A [Candidatus Omnitrophota bacterium]
GLMQAELIAVGTELLLGFTLNTNAAFLSRKLAELGVDCYHHVTVGDNPVRLKETLVGALKRSDCVITCGGLGPTVDDITLATIAKTLERPLVLDQDILTQIRGRFQRLGIPMPQSNLRQAYVPRGAIILPNRIGTAPGFILPLRKKILIALPGPPRELEPIFITQVLPWLEKRASPEAVLISRTLKLTGITESEVDEKVSDLLKLKGETTVGIYAHPGQVDLRITAKHKTKAGAGHNIRRIEQEIRKRMGALVYGADDDTLEEIAGKLLGRQRKTLSVAESCTGGLVGHRITQIPGSSAYFVGGAVSYADAVKSGFLGVPPGLLRKQGAVSEEVAKAMAQGIQKLARASVGLAITGIAGPAGGSKEKPVGLIYIALSNGKQVLCRRYTLTGDRSTIKWKASQSALDLLRLYLSGQLQ